MKILALKEKNNIEKRVSITANLIAKYKNIGHEIFIESGAGVGCNISDKDFKDAGAVIVDDVKDNISLIDAILTVNSPDEKDVEKFTNLKKGVLLLGSLNPYLEKSKTEQYAKLNISAIAAELFPRITRAQSIDILSSQSNLAGYRAVIDAVYELQTAVPMMMTAAGTVSPAKIMIMGAGVAGLQAIATAKRLGAVVCAFDVREVAKEQVESLGAKFIEVKNNESLETKGGYAKEMSDDYKKRQQQTILDNISKQDIVITTALIPGKVAPKLITKEMVKSMKSGSIIIDMAASMGGNCELTKKDKIVNKDGVKIFGYSNMNSRIALDSSRLYAKNLFNFIELITDKETKKISLDINDEIIKASLITSEGNILFQ